MLVISSSQSEVLTPAITNEKNIQGTLYDDAARICFRLCKKEKKQLLDICKRALL